MGRERPWVGRVHRETKPLGHARVHNAGPRRMTSAQEYVLRLQRLAGNRATASLLGVQRFEVPTESMLKGTGEKVEKFGENAPAADALLWELTGPGQAQRLILLGTVHVSVKEIPYFNKAGPLLDYLEGTTFDGVFEEVVHEAVPKAKEIAATVRQLVALGKPVPEPPVGTAAAGRRAFTLYDQKSRPLYNQLGTGSEPPLVDDFFSYLAAKGGSVKSLESEDARQMIRKTYEAGSGPNAEPGGFTGETSTSESESEPPPVPEDELVYAGNQKELAARRAKELKQGKDRQDIEARNRYWLTESQKVSEYEGRTVLWVVGASHIAGLAANLQSQGWKANPIAL